MKNATLDRAGIGAKRLGRDHDRGVFGLMTVAIPIRDVARWPKPRRPRERRLRAQLHSRNLIRLQHEPHVELKLIFDVETHEIAKHTETPLGRQKTLEVFPTQWTKLDLEARL